MATRNRTIVFRKHRDAIKAVRTPDSSLIGGGPVIEMTSLMNSNRSYTPLSTEDPTTSSRDVWTVGLPPAWVDISEEITANVQRARIKMSELVKAHSKALMPSFGDGRDDQRRIESLTREITDLLRKSEKRLKMLSTSEPSEDSNIRTNVQRSLATDLQNLSVEFRRKQSTYLKRLKQQQEGQDGVDMEINVNGTSSTYEDEFSDMDFSKNQMKVEQGGHMSAQREKEIQQVVQSVHELAQIMKDLSILVIDQGTIVDRIDHNIQNVATTVQQGFKELQKAERTQRQGGMVKCATVLVIMCFVMLLLLVLKEIFF